MLGEEILLEEIATAIRGVGLNRSAPMGMVSDTDPEAEAQEVIRRFRQRMTEVDLPHSPAGELAARLLVSLGEHSEEKLRALYGDARLVGAYMILQDKVPPSFNWTEEKERRFQELAKIDKVGVTAFEFENLKRERPR